MDVVKLGKKGQVSIPKRILSELGLEGDSMLIVDSTDDGAILLRPAGVYPIETYSDERIRKFLEANTMTPEEEARVSAKLDQLRSARVE
ncbi:MAG: AbrB/MazE/SpoVT family DNA-binding domain-containing protein [Trueperaceae bacterium]